jgi:hypothetical protein
VFVTDDTQEGEATADAEVGNGGGRKAAHEPPILEVVALKHLQVSLDTLHTLLLLACITARETHRT